MKLFFIYPGLLPGPGSYNVGVSPAVSPSPQGQSPSPSPSGQSPSPSSVSPSPLDQSPSPSPVGQSPSPSPTKVRVSPDSAWTHETNSRKVLCFNLYPF